MERKIKNIEFMNNKLIESGIELEKKVEELNDLCEKIGRRLRKLEDDDDWK